MKHISEVPQNVKYPFDLFKVGDGVTMPGWSDSIAGTVISVSKNGKRVVVQEDKASLDPTFKPNFIPGGFCAHCTNQQEQSYTYERNEIGALYDFSIRKWRGRYMWTRIGSRPDGGQKLYLGRNKFYDYNF